MISEDLVAERIAIQAYSEIIRWLGNEPNNTTNIEGILAARGSAEISEPSRKDELT